MGLFNRKKETSAYPFLFPYGSRRLFRDAGALYNSAFWACVVRLASLYASTPWDVYRKDRDGNVMPGSLPISELLREQNRLQTRYDFKFVMGLNYELHGTALAYIRRTAKGTPAALVPIPTGSVIASYDEQGNRSYTYGLAGLRFSDRDMLVINKTPDGIDSVLSPIQYAKNDMDLEERCRQMQRDYFNGASIVGNIIKVPSTLTDEQKDMVKARFDSAGEGGFRNFVVDNRIDVAPLQASSVDIGKLTEALRMSVTDVCRRFTVPPFIANDMTGAYNNLAEQMTQFMVLSFNPRLRSWEDALNRVLCTGDEFIEFNRAALTQGTPAQQAEYFSKLVNNGLMTPNEARRALGRTAEKGGDGLFMMTNMAPLDLISAGAYGANMQSAAWNSEKRAQSRNLEEEYKLSTEEKRREKDRFFVSEATSQAKGARRELESLLRRQTKAETGFMRTALETGGTEKALNDLAGYIGELAERMKGDYEAVYARVMAKMVPAVAKQVGGEATVTDEQQKAFVESYVSSLMGRHGGFIRKMVARYAEKSPEELEAELQHLEDDYPTSESNEEVNRSSNAFTLFAFECLGVTYYHVVANSDACEFCSNLDGQGCGAHGYILNKGEDITTDGIVRKIDKNYRHPPFHGGCSCHIAPW